MSMNRNLIACFLAAVLAAVTPAAFAQRAVQSPVTVQVIRTKTDSKSQQIGLRMTVRNMSQKEVNVRVEALFIAEPAYGGGKEFIFCERKTGRAFTGGEMHEFNTESEEGASRLYEVNGVYYSYTTLKIKGYITRVFADGQLVNVSGSVPSMQKLGWDDALLAKLGYTGQQADPARVVASVTPTPTPVPTPDPVVPTYEEPRKQPRAVMPRDEDDPPAVRPTTSPVSPPPVAVTPAPTPAPTPAVPSGPWDEAAYTATAKRYNAAVDAYQTFLQKRGSQDQLKKIEDELHECAGSFEKMQGSAPSSYNIEALLAKCRQTIFAVHGTRLVQP